MIASTEEPERPLCHGIKRVMMETLRWVLSTVAGTGCFETEPPAVPRDTSR